MPQPDDFSRFAANVESIMRADDLVAAYGDGDAKALAAILVGPREASIEGLLEVVEDAQRTIFALLLLNRAALGELAKAHKSTPELTRQALRAWVLAAQVKDEPEAGG